MIKRRVYTKQFKIEAVEHTLDSTDLGVSYHLLCKWRSETY